MSPDKEIERQDVEALLETRRDLGPEYDAALVDAFADRVEQAIASRVDARLAERHKEREEESSRDGRQLALAIVSLGTGIPLTAIAGGIAETFGVAVTWAGIVAVNASYAWGRRKS